MGFFGSVWKAIKTVVKVVINVVETIIKTVIDIVARVLSIIDIILTLFGVKIKKRIIVKVVILNSAKGRVAEPADIRPALEELNDIFKKEMNVTIRNLDSPDLIQVRPKDDVAPESVLNYSCSGAFWSHFGNTGWYLRRRLRNWTFGITVFITKNIKGDTIGCSINLIGDYAIVEAAGLVSNVRIVAHEVGHSCGLWHVGSKNNLMKRSSFGNKLNRGQEAMARSSRHVSIFY